MIVNCYFYENFASDLGGVVYISEGRPLFEGCTFYGNIANSGGAVYIRGGEPTFTRCTFYGNVAELDGGAFVINGGRTILNSCSFKMNAAGTKGGAVSLITGELHMTDSSLISNVAGVFDGGVHPAGGDAVYSNVLQDGNEIGRNANTLLQDIQSRRQANLYTQTGFAPLLVYDIPGSLEREE